MAGTSESCYLPASVQTLGAMDARQRCDPGPLMRAAVAQRVVSLGPSAATKRNSGATPAPLAIRDSAKRRTDTPGLKINNVKELSEKARGLKEYILRLHTEGLVPPWILSEICSRVSEAGPQATQALKPFSCTSNHARCFNRAAGIMRCADTIYTVPLPIRGQNKKPHFIDKKTAEYVDYPIMLPHEELS